MERAKHGGRIWIDSELGKGGMVCFTLSVRQKHTYLGYGATYTIGTGSYPQIIHAHEYNATLADHHVHLFHGHERSAARGVDTGDKAILRSVPNLISFRFIENRSVN